MSKRNGTYFITHCCRRKSRKKGLLPARQRYLAGYIDDVLKFSKSQGAGFLILSGEFGFLKENAKIPYYDKLLTYSDFEALNKVADRQYKKYKFRKAVFFHIDTKIDGKVRTYVDFMKEFSLRNNVNAEFVRIDLREIANRRYID
ncbi:MAG: hypothetical protein ABIJ15_00285 [bacterium]